MRRGARVAPPRSYTRVDRQLGAAEWSSQIVGELSEWIGEELDREYSMADADDGGDRSGKCLEALRAELRVASHLGVQAVVVRPPCTGDWTHSRSGDQRACPRPLAMFAREINNFLRGGVSSVQVWLRLPVLPPPHGGSGHRHAEDIAWQCWDTIRRMCDENPRLGVVLDMSDGGTAMPQRERLSRWMGEPLRAVILSTDCFVGNKTGFPVLHKRHQEMVACMFVRNVRVILGGRCLHEVDTAPPSQTQDVTMTGGGGGGGSLRFYWEYISYLFRRMDPLNEMEAMESSYRDCLQFPLQPLMDNLEASTYEVFERDGAKYDLYEEAVHQCLLDEMVKDENEEGFHGEYGVTVLMVVGSGRGPIVSAALRAADRCGRKMRVYALEKNPNAVITLNSMLESEPLWADRVTIIDGDMRDASPALDEKGGEIKADIIVSELLGSFGDNELSPECLDGAQRFLRGYGSDAEDRGDGDGPMSVVRRGVMIPQSYTSFIAPITCSKLWNDVRSFSSNNTANSLQHFETPYVVKLHSHAVLAAPKPVFTFVHPSHSAAVGGDNASDIDNNRYTEVSFDVRIDTNPITTPPYRARHQVVDGVDEGTAQGADLQPPSCCHGFAGYFECKLYGDVLMSTLPVSHSKGMYSWFPIYFPIRHPIRIDGASTSGSSAVQAQFWRCRSKTKVWYEWGVTSPQVSPIHNPCGRSYWVGL